MINDSCFVEIAGGCNGKEFKMFTGRYALLFI